MREIEETEYTLNSIDRVLLTHYDIDHVGGLIRLGIEAPVYVGMPDGAFLTGQRKPPLTNSKGALQRALRPFMRGHDLSIEPVEDGDEIGSFTAYHTPGHTPGHIAYMSESLSLGFVGDLIIERRGNSSRHRGISATIPDKPKRVFWISPIGSQQSKRSASDTEYRFSKMAVFDWQNSANR
ncbi:MBL fold metallo-hydrolase [Halocatena marina]|uniref:MBL fold metallo-hydrolase n=2 Tax=Halocatena marina TaxID=2934937 RepID=A0ABD5YM13_9EURY